MANILSLAVRVTGDASGLQLNPVEKALQRLQQESDKTSAIFEKFAQTSELGAKAQETFNAASSALLATLKAGTITRDEYVRQFNELGEAARRQAAALEEGARVTASTLTVEEKRSQELQRLDGLLQARAISEETYNRAVAEASGANAEAARLRAEQEKQLNAAIAEGARVTESMLTVEEKRARELERLESLLEKGAISEDTFARAKAEASGANAEAARQLAEQERQLNAVIAEGARVTESTLTTEEKRARELERLESLLSQGAISEETFARAKAEASGANAEAARQQAEQDRLAAEALRERQSLESRAASIITANLTIQERYDRELAELNNLQREGLLTQEQYNRAVAAARKPLDDAAAAAERAAQASGNTALKFNELSGVFAVLPGPLGNIAGRISGITSASEGLTRIFSGGLQSGLSNVVGSFTALATPVNLALAGVAAFGASATAITRGLVDLEARVKGLAAAADQLGVSFQSVQVLEEAASRAGTSLDAASAGLQKFAARVNDARSGTGAAAEAFRELGISQEELASTAPTELAARVAEELGKIEDPARRASLQVDLLGKSGEQLRRTFSEIPGAADDLEKFGAAISREDQERIEALGPAFDGFAVAIRGLGQSVITPFAGIVAGLTETLASLINAVTAAAQAIGSVLKPVLDGVGSAFKLFGDGINNTVGFFRSFFVVTEQAEERIGALEDAAELASKVAEASKEDQKLLEEQEKFLAGYAGKVSDAINQSAQFGQAGFDAALQYQTAIAELQKQLDRGILNAESFRQEADKATAAFKIQIDALKEAAAETQAITDRVDGLLEKANELPQIQQDILAVEAEIARVEAAAAEARASGQTDQADALAARLGQLDQLQASLEEQSDELNQAADEAAQGFGSGFDEAFESVQAGIADLTEEANEFGQAGFDAALRLQEGIAAAQEQVRDGIFNRAAFEAEVARQEQLLQQQLANLEKEKAAREEASRVRFQAEIDANERVQGFLQQQFGTQAQATEEQIARRQQAAENIIAIERQIALEQQSLAAAREQGDLASARAGVARIDSLKNALQIEGEISAGRQLQVEQQQAIAEKTESIAKAQQQQAAEAQKQTEEFQKVLQAQAAENERVLANRRQLATASNQAAQGADIRTSEGANAFIQAVQGGFDPQLAVQRQQLKVQQRIAVGLEANLGALGFQTFRFPAAAGA